jgi:RNA 2',3'-cyclic 3'-phosphodiesterase
MLRLFVALPIPEEVTARVTPLQRGVPGARWSPSNNLHLTLRFLGDVDERVAEDVDTELGRISQAPFDIALKGAGFFGGERPHALWLGVEPNPALHLLRQRCEKACRTAGLAPDPRAFTPHVTIAYLDRSAEPARVFAFERNQSLNRAGPWTADRFHLYSSHLPARGPSQYRIEAEYPLTG